MTIKTMKNDKTLKDFLKKNKACEDGYIFAKDLSLEEFLETCSRGDWILWLFNKSNPDSIRELTLAKGYCANTVIHLMEDVRSRKAVKAAIDFGNGKIDKEELKKAASAAKTAACAAYFAASAAYSAANSASDSAACAADSAAYFAAKFAADPTASAADPAARKENQALTAKICRQYLPLNIWNINN